MRYKTADLKPMSFGGRYTDRAVLSGSDSTIVRAFYAYGSWACCQSRVQPTDFSAPT
jgi:hypothetical protein